MPARKLNPKFELLNNADTLNEGVLGIIKTPKQIKHEKVLEQLLKQFEPIDFKLLAFPQINELRKKLEHLDVESDEAKAIRKEIDRLKINQKHLLVLAIENILKVAEKNRWGICKNQDFIYLYNGEYWAHIDKEVFQKFLGEAAEKMGVAKFSARYYEFREKLFKQFLGVAYLPVPETDDERVLTNLANGTFEVDSKGMRLRPFNRSDFLKHQLSFNYNPKATAPIFQKYLDEVLPEKEKQNLLAEYMGYIFIKHSSKRLKVEKALILLGSGANGKSVFFEVINALIGKENVSNYSLSDLTDQSGYYRAMIANKLLNYGSELDGKLEANIFKKLVSGEALSARLPYGRPMMVDDYAKMIFNCNELPRDVEQTNAYFRRFLIIPFDVTIPEEKQDKELHLKIIDNELSGVFNWVLKGLNRLLKQKRFSECKAAIEALECYKTESNSVQMFLNEHGYKSSPDAHKLIKELYYDYRSFCMDDGFKPVNKTNFKKRLNTAGILTNRLNIGNVAYLSN